MNNQKLKYFIFLAILIIAVAVVWILVSRKQPATENTNRHPQPQDLIPELDKRLPKDVVIVGYDPLTGQLTFKLSADTFTGLITDKTQILKQVKDSKGALGTQPARVNDLVKGKKAMVSPAPKDNKVYDLELVQVIW